MGEGLDTSIACESESDPEIYIRSVALRMIVLTPESFGMTLSSLKFCF